MPGPIPIKKPETGTDFYSMTMSFDEAAVQGLFELGLSREELFQRIMVCVAEEIWDALPMPRSKMPS